jgi:hypothetical protein
LDFQAEMPWSEKQVKRLATELNRPMSPDVLGVLLDTETRLRFSQTSNALGARVVS